MVRTKSLRITSWVGRQVGKEFPRSDCFCHAERLRLRLRLAYDDKLAKLGLATQPAAPSWTLQHMVMCLMVIGMIGWFEAASSCSHKRPRSPHSRRRSQDRSCSSRRVCSLKALLQSCIWIVRLIATDWTPRSRSHPVEIPRGPTVQVFVALIGAAAEHS